MKKILRFLVSKYWVCFFSAFGLLSTFVIWPLFKDVGFLVAGILLNVLALTYWFNVVRTNSTDDFESQ